MPNLPQSRLLPFCGFLREGDIVHVGKRVKIDDFMEWLVETNGELLPEGKLTYGYEWAALITKKPSKGVRDWLAVKLLQVKQQDKKMARLIGVKE